MNELGIVAENTSRRVIQPRIFLEQSGAGVLELELLMESCLGRLKSSWIRIQ